MVWAVGSARRREEGFDAGHERPQSLERPRVRSQIPAGCAVPFNGRNVPGVAPGRERNREEPDAGVKVEHAVGRGHGIEYGPHERRNQVAIALKE